MFTPINGVADNTPIPLKNKSTILFIKGRRDYNMRLANWIVKVHSRPRYDCNYKVQKPKANFPGRVMNSGCGSLHEHHAEWSVLNLEKIATAFFLFLPTPQI